MNVSKLLLSAVLSFMFIGVLSSCHSSRKSLKKLYVAVKKDQTNAHVSWKGDSIRVIYPELAMFDFGKDEVRQDAYPALKRFAGILNNYTWVSFNINGYTDNVGPVDVNQTLSERRAANAKHMLETDGISTDRMMTNGMGSSNPLMDNSTDAGRQANRRVEFILYRKK